MVSVLRHSQYFDKDLSIVAELDGEIVGHVLFSIFPIIVMNENRLGAFLAPICVDSKLQKQGIGKMLIEEGHKRLKDKGVSVALLCGHESYYPKFGYINKMFAISGVKISIDTESIKTEDITERSVRNEDLEWIKGQWGIIHRDNRLALYPGDTIGQWFNHSLIYRSSMIYENDELLGYIRYRNTYPLVVKEIIAVNCNAEKMIAYIMKENLKKPIGDAILSLSVDSGLKLFTNSKNIKIEEKIRTSNALMMKIIDEEDKLLSQYVQEAELDNKNIGIIIFPPVMEIDD